MRASGTAPKRRLSIAAASWLSDSSHQPSGVRRAARLTRRRSGCPGCLARTIWPGRILCVRRTSSQSPGRRAGSMERSATLTVVSGVLCRTVAGAPSGAGLAPVPGSLRCRAPSGVGPGERGSVGSASTRVGERESMRLLTRLLEPKTVAYAHCDLPCGVYDPAQARIEAESVKAIIEKYQQNTDPEFRARAIYIKEQRSELVKHHLWVLWTDYFKPPHFEKYPHLHQLFNQATKLEIARASCRERA